MLTGAVPSTDGMVQEVVRRVDTGEGEGDKVMERFRKRGIWRGLVNAKKRLGY
jgi:uncharacterized protein YhfF